MIVEYVRFKAPAEGFGRAAVLLDKAPQCVGYELARCVDEPDHYILRIVWTSARGHEEFFSDIEEMSHYEVILRKTEPTLYEWAGGEEAFLRLTEVFYGLVKQDEVVGPLFAHMDSAHPKYVAMWLGEVFGGPDRYTAERGGYAHMLSQHLGKGITEAQRRRWVSLLMDSADEVGLPDDPEFRAAFVSYIEWGTRLALANSQPGATPPREAPVPRWGWGVAPPYQAS